jgi:hypothetical protein
LIISVRKTGIYQTKASVHGFGYMDGELSGTLTV